MHLSGLEGACLFVGADWTSSPLVIHLYLTTRRPNGAGGTALSPQRFTAHCVLSA